MPTLRLIVRYDGTGLGGWQRQPGVATVQEHLESAAGAVAGEAITMRAPGRTDAGVHALAQVVAFRTTLELPEATWVRKLSAKLPPQIVVLEARVAPDDFDPHRAAAGKRYRYLLLTTPLRDPLLRDRAWHLWGPIDLEVLAREAADLVGEHDFGAFCAPDPARRSARRRIFRAAVVPGWSGHPGLVALEIEGAGFLKHMVRIVAGTLVEVARGRLPPGTVRDRLADGDRQRTGPAAPPEGLYLDEVFLKPAWLLPGDSLRPLPAYAESRVGESTSAAGNDDE